MKQQQYIITAVPDRAVLPWVPSQISTAIASVLLMMMCAYWRIEMVDGPLHNRDYHGTMVLDLIGLDSIRAPRLPDATREWRRRKTVT
jgi:hypothetical protein